jgi:hypothetical protein
MQRPGAGSWCIGRSSRSGIGIVERVVRRQRSWPPTTPTGEPRQGASSLDASEHLFDTGWVIRRHVSSRRGRPATGHREFDRRPRSGAHLPPPCANRRPHRVGRRREWIDTVAVVWSGGDLVYVRDVRNRLRQDRHLVPHRRPPEPLSLSFQSQASGVRDGRDSDRRSNSVPFSSRTRT